MTNVETVKAIYEDFGRGNIPQILERLGESVAWEYGYPDRNVPWLAPRQGRSAVGAFFESLAALEFRKFEVKSILGEGPLVVAVIDCELVVRATGKSIKDPDEVHLWTFGTRGEITRFRHVVDTLQHVEAIRT